METIKTKADNVKITLTKSFLALIEEVTEKIEKEYYENEVSIFYEDYNLVDLRMSDKGIRVIYENKEGKELRQYIKFKDLTD